MANFFELYPDLAPVDIVGDGHSCQYIAVGLAACQSPLIAGALRGLAVKAIREKWSDMGPLVMNEVSDQSGVPLCELNQQRCIELLSGSASSTPLWGNHCTLSQLPHIVKKNIVVLTSSGGRPFKHVFALDGCKDTVFIGFLPELHFFALKVRETVRLNLKAGEKGEQVEKITAWIANGFHRTMCTALQASNSQIGAVHNV